MSDFTNTPESSLKRKRHGCLTALLVWLGTFSAIGSLANIFMGEQLIKQVAVTTPNLPKWSATGTFIVGLLGIPAVLSLIAIWRWKKWGVYLYGITIFGVTILNAIILGIRKSSVGLIGFILLMPFVYRQWSDFE